MLQVRLSRPAVEVVCGLPEHGKEKQRLHAGLCGFAPDLQAWTRRKIAVKRYVATKESIVGFQATVKGRLARLEVARAKRQVLLSQVANPQPTQSAAPVAEPFVALHTRHEDMTAITGDPCCLACSAR